MHSKSTKNQTKATGASYRIRSEYSDYQIYMNIILVYIVRSGMSIMPIHQD
jgi:hypothetical protein